MSNLIFASTAALALVAGTALAQEIQTTRTTETTTTGVPVAPTYSYETTKKTVDSAGNRIEQSEVYKTGLTGTSKTTSYEAKTSDGTETETKAHEERTTLPDGTIVTKTETKTTTEK